MALQLGAKSSSGLFSALLTEAELKGDYAEDVYLLKPGNSTDPQAQFAVTRLSGSADEARGQPVVLLHGLYRNRQQWIDGGQGLALHLLSAGYDVWLPEMREHGSSPLRHQPRADEPEDIAQYDIPAMAMFIREQTGRPAVWIGIDVGALCILFGRFQGLLSDNLVAGFISLGGPCDKEAISVGRRLVNAGIRKRLRHETGSEEYERSEWIAVWRKRFNLLSRWRNRPVRLLAEYLNSDDERFHIIAPANFSGRLARWQGYKGVSLDFVVTTADTEYPSARHWLGCANTMPLLLPLVQQKLQNLFKRGATTPVTTRASSESAQPEGRL